MVPPVNFDALGRSEVIQRELSMYSAWFLSILSVICHCTQRDSSIYSLLSVIPLCTQCDTLYSAWFLSILSVICHCTQCDSSLYSVLSVTYHCTQRDSSLCSADSSLYSAWFLTVFLSLTCLRCSISRLILWIFLGGWGLGGGVWGGGDFVVSWLLCGISTICIDVCFRSRRCKPFVVDKQTD